MNSSNLTKTLAEELFSIFQGSDIAHGTFVSKGTSINGKKQGTAKVIREPTTVEMWQKHLNGEVGIGLIPIKSNNTCFWGAIDIDEYDIQHKKVCENLLKNKIPAVVGRTKSGGAHIWIFVSTAIPAEDMQRKMTELSASLGFSGSEIFPKQTTILL